MCVHALLRARCIPSELVWEGSNGTAMPDSLEEANTLLDEERNKTKQAAEVGSMLLAKNEELTKQVAEKQMQVEVITKESEDLGMKVKELGAKTERLESANSEWEKQAKGLEAENEELRDAAGLAQGAAGSAAQRAKNETDNKNKDLAHQVEELKGELEQIKAEHESATKARDRLKAEKDELAGKLQEAEGRNHAMEETMKQKDEELRSYSKLAGDDAQGEVRAMKEKTDTMFRETEMMRKKINELQDVNNILTKQHEDDQTLIEDVKATNMMLREALETKELEWGTADSNLANFAPKESLLGEIEQHFNRFQTFGSPQRGSSKMPNFMDVVKRDFENLAMRIHRLRQKMEKKWPEPPSGTPGQPAAVGAPAPPAAET